MSFSPFNSGWNQEANWNSYVAVLQQLQRQCLLHELGGGKVSCDTQGFEFQCSNPFFASFLNPALVWRKLIKPMTVATPSAFDLANSPPIKVAGSCSPARNWADSWTSLRLLAGMKPTQKQPVSGSVHSKKYPTFHFPSKSWYYILNWVNGLTQLVLVLSPRSLGSVWQCIFLSRGHDVRRFRLPGQFPPGCPAEVRQDRKEHTGRKHQVRCQNVSNTFHKSLVSQKACLG